MNGQVFFGRVISLSVGGRPGRQGDGRVFEGDVIDDWTELWNGIGLR